MVGMTAGSVARSQPISALILAGGRGLRMGGADKGMQSFRGMPLAQWTLERLRAQQGDLIGEIMVNANRSLVDYATLGVTVYPDASPDQFAGPLAGFLAGLEHCRTPYLLVVPCDTPLFPLDLAQRLYDALIEHRTEIAVAAAPESGHSGLPRTRAQPVFSLLARSLKRSLADFMQGTDRKIVRWTAQHRNVLVPFDQPGDDPQAFANANTLSELRLLE